MTTLHTTPTTPFRPPFDEVLAGGAPWQRWLQRRYRDCIPDLDAEITAAVWECYAAGVVDQDRLFSAARTAIRRVARREQRFAAATALPAPQHERADPFDRLVDHLAAKDVLDRLSIPEEALPWARAITDRQPTTSAAMVRGRRWAARARSMRSDRDAA